MLGDATWKETVSVHDERATAEMDRSRAATSRPRATGCSPCSTDPRGPCGAHSAIGAAVAPLGLEIRAGVHTGEVEPVGEDIRGIAVHVAARVAALAGPERSWSRAP